MSLNVLRSLPIFLETTPNCDFDFLAIEKLAIYANITRSQSYNINFVSKKTKYVLNFIMLRYFNLYLA